MRYNLAIAAALTAVVLPTGAGAQLQSAETTVMIGPAQTTIINGTVVAPPPGPGGASTTAANLRAFTYQPVCEIRREQFVDENGWRARDIRICR